ncbi:hypothetical protein [Nonomuraea jiangxiensis]|uniref:Uncharacterized protein n=1 Tax=Nonomuraea jiangxiensis TaxID=633440 RepID=A0A1G9RBD1_9ACTN|nr:hypothetical protein [Nonomuraea jiangxiensis]SDM19705.1 hypothetical protein SAMN05421869_1388 [Nonomuraea jiangxiensis]
MSNAARHVLGVVAGLLIPPLVLAGLCYGVGEYQSQRSAAFQFSWLGLGVIVVTAIVLAFLAGSRLSPIASLLGGLAFTALGILPLLEILGTQLLPDNGWMPAPVLIGFQTVAYSGWLLFIGVALLMVSMFPSRWRGRGDRVVYSPSYDLGPSYGSEPAPFMPFSDPEDATRPMRRE